MNVNKISKLIHRNYKSILSKASKLKIKKLTKKTYHEFLFQFFLKNLNFNENTNYLYDLTIKPTRYSGDFVFNQEKMIFEIDGIYWHNKIRDKKRDLKLKKLGYQIYRFTDKKIEKNPQFVYDKLVDIFTNKKNVVSPLGQV